MVSYSEIFERMEDNVEEIEEKTYKPVLNNDCLSIIYRMDLESKMDKLMEELKTRFYIRDYKPASAFDEERTTFFDDLQNEKNDRVVVYKYIRNENLLVVNTIYQNENQIVIKIKDDEIVDTMYTGFCSN